MVSTKKLAGRSLLLLTVLLFGGGLHAQEEIVINGGFEDYAMDDVLGFEMPTNTGNSPHNWDLKNDVTGSSKVIVDPTIARTGDACLQVTCDDSDKVQISYVIPTSLATDGSTFEFSVWAKDPVLFANVVPAMFVMNWNNPKPNNKWIGIPDYNGLSPIGDWVEGRKTITMDSAVDTVYKNALPATLFKFLFDVKTMGNSIYLDDASIIMTTTAVREPFYVQAPQKTMEAATVRTFDLRGAVVPSFRVKTGSHSTSALVEQGSRENGAVLKMVR